MQTSNLKGTLNYWLLQTGASIFIDYLQVPRYLKEDGLANTELLGKAKIL